jgi:uncharacterized protein
MTTRALYVTGLAVLMLAPYSPSAQAASFNCEKAETADEKAICADRALNDEDVEMSVLYRQLKPLLAMGARGDLEDGQVNWLKRRQACGGNRACLSQAYADRLLQLRGTFEELAKRGPY